MLTAGELSRMRRDANLLLPDTATIYRRILADDGRGGKLASYVARTPTVKCRLSATSIRGRARDAVNGGKIEPAEGWIVSLPIGTDVIETDRLLINGTNYEVQSSLDGRSFAVNIRVICKRV